MARSRRASGVDEAGRRRDRHQARDRAGDHAQRGRPPNLIQSQHAQIDGRGRGGHVRGHERVDRHAVGGQRAAGVEAEPAEPQQRRAQHGERQIVRRRDGSGKPLRLPRTSAAASAAMPALMCTTMPPAKSSAPSPPAAMPPLPQTQCATGIVHERRPQQAEHAEGGNLMRSAKAPMISPGVITANIIWKIMKSGCGIVGA